MAFTLKDGRLEQAIWCPSPNFDERDVGSEADAVRALIIHCICLPPGEYGGGEIKDFFKNKLDEDAHPYFKNISQLTVSSHFLVERTGCLVQFVNTQNRAWHAGESICQERSKVNDFSIGIELEGWDEDPAGFTCEQYQSLIDLTRCLMAEHSQITSKNIFSHSDIAPGRKPDPGPYFDWNRYLNHLEV